MPLLKSAFAKIITPQSIFLLALIISVFSATWIYKSDLTLQYNDAISHLNIARRVVDSPTSGISQLGAYWLPLPHILMFPLIEFNLFWQTGLAGVIPNMIFFIAGVVFLYKLVFSITSSKLSSLTASLVYMLNPNLLYMQSTPMTEVIFLSAMIIGVYYFHMWLKHNFLPSLLLSGLFIALASLIRYEGWGLVIAATGIMGLQWLTGKLNRKWEGILIIFSSMAWLGIFMWIAWGAILVNDPLDFMRNSVGTVEEIDPTLKTNYTGEDNLPIALAVNILSLNHISGPIFALLLPICIFIYLVKNKFRILRPEVNYIFLLLVPFLFDLVTLYTGNVPIEVPELSALTPPGNYFNIRYSLFSLPAIAIIISLASKKYYYQVILIGASIFSFIYLLDTNYKPVVLKDAGAQGRTIETLVAADWLNKNYDSGFILASTGSMENIMFESKLNLENYIVEGSYKYWEESLGSPEKYVKWVLMDIANPRDSVTRYMNKQHLYAKFDVLYSIDSLEILKRRESL